MPKGSKINIEKLRNKVKDSIDRFVSKAREIDKAKINISIRDIANDIDRPVSTLRDHTTNRFLNRKYESVTYKKWKGLYIVCEEWVEERKAERKRIAEGKANGKD